MIKVIFTLVFAIGCLSNTAKSKEKSKYTDCKWFSDVEPKAYIHFKKHIPGLDRNLKRADLIYKGSIVRSIVYGRPNGYNTRWWAYEKLIETNGKRKNIEMIGGGSKILFFGNIPENSITHSEKVSDLPIKVLLVGLGRDLYYSRKYIGEEYSLVLAAGGLWQYGDECLMER